MLSLKKYTFIILTKEMVDRFRQQLLAFLTRICNDTFIRLNRERVNRFRQQLMIFLTRVCNGL